MVLKTIYYETQMKHLKLINKNVCFKNLNLKLIQN